MATFVEERDTPRVLGRPQPYWEDLIVGDSVQSAGITITEAHLVSWAGLTGDIVQFHVDADFASKTRFGQRIAHGPLTLSVAMGLLTQTGYFTNVVAWLGLDAVRAKSPVLIGDSINATATLTESRPTSKPGTGVWTFEYDVRNQDGDTVMSFISSFLVTQRSK